LRLPYSLCAPSQRAGTFVLRELGGELALIRELMVAKRERLAAGLGRLGLSVAPSDANFLWAETPGPAAPVFAALMAQGLLGFTSWVCCGTTGHWCSFSRIRTGRRVSAHS
jgi:histidinol-phosphate aminotransferase